MSMRESERGSHFQQAAGAEWAREMAISASSTSAIIRFERS